MEVQVRYFAVVRERVGRDTESVTVVAPTTAGQLLDHLAILHPSIVPLRRYLQIAVNRTIVPLSTPLADGDELALLPPVAGGEEPRWARLIGEPPSAERCTRAVVGPGRGAVVTFTGCVRDFSQGKPVVRLEYEAYAAMAEECFFALCAEIEQEWPGVRAAVEHRVGSLDVGDIAVAIACAAPHRAAAFQACQAFIDRLKERAPIWKKEHGSDGATWVGLGP